MEARAGSARGWGGGLAVLGLTVAGAIYWGVEPFFTPTGREAPTGFAIADYAALGVAGLGAAIAVIGGRRNYGD